MRVYLRDGSAQTILRAEIKVADQTFHLTQSLYTDTGPTSPSVDPITPGAWQGSQWSANFEVTGMTRSRKKSRRERDLNPGSSAPEADALTTRPTRRPDIKEAFHDILRRTVTMAFQWIPSHCGIIGQAANIMDFLMHCRCCSFVVFG